MRSNWARLWLCGWNIWRFLAGLLSRGELSDGLSKEVSEEVSTPHCSAPLE
jgi:hypothetical protein